MWHSRVDNNDTSPGTTGQDFHASFDEHAPSSCARARPFAKVSLLSFPYNARHVAFCPVQPTQRKLITYPRCLVVFERRYRSRDWIIAPVSRYTRPTVHFPRFYKGNFKIRRAEEMRFDKHWYRRLTIEEDVFNDSRENC